MSDTLYFIKPKLRNKVQIEDKNGFLHLVYHGNSVDMAPTEKISMENIKFFLQLLDGTHTIEQLNEKIDFLQTDEIMDTLSELDEYWMLTEGNPQEIQGKTGLEFIMDLEDLFAEWQNITKENKMTRLILDSHASKNLLIGFAFEYYHVTRRCHECVSPAIAKAQGKIRDKVLEFFIEEYRHDKILIKSLTSLGYDKKEIEQSLPLAYTQSIMNMLSKWAHTDLLSFMAGIFIFEGTDYDGIAYKEALSKYDMPEDFIKYQNTHGDINIEGDHGHVTREFFIDINYVSPEEQIRVINNIRLLNELINRMSEHIIEYYDRPDAVIPRSFAELAKVN